MPLRPRSAAACEPTEPRPMTTTRELPSLAWHLSPRKCKFRESCSRNRDSGSPSKEASRIASSSPFVSTACIRLAESKARKTTKQAAEDTTPAAVAALGVCRNTMASVATLAPTTAAAMGLITDGIFTDQDESDVLVYVADMRACRQTSAWMEPPHTMW
eukprot:scaffold54863_cov31-Tisochrysis_lutea.AAC.3